MPKHRKRYQLGVQQVGERPTLPSANVGQAGIGIATGAASGFAVGGPVGAVIGGGLSLIGSIAGRQEEKKVFEQDLQQFKRDDLAERNRGIFSENEIPQQLNQIAKNGMYATGTEGVEVERDELIFSKTSTGKYLLKADFKDGKTHNEGGENFQADEGDIIFPGKDRKKVLKAFKSQDFPKLEAMRIALPKDTDFAQDGLDKTDPKKKSDLAQQYAFLNDPNFVPPQIPIQQEGYLQEIARINQESLQKDFGPATEGVEFKGDTNAKFQLRQLEKGLREGKPGITQELIDRFKASEYSGFTPKQINKTDPKQNPFGLRGGNAAFGLGFIPGSTESGFQGNPLAELPTFDVNPDGSTTPITKGDQAFEAPKGGGYVDPRGAGLAGGPQTNLTKFREKAQTGFGFSTNPLQQFTPRNITSVAGRNSLLTQMQGTQDSIATEGEALNQGSDFGNIAGYIAQAAGPLANLFPGESERQVTPKVNLQGQRFVDTSERLRQQSNIQQRLDVSNARNTAGGNVQNFAANRRQAGVTNLRNLQNINSIEYQRADRIAQQNVGISNREALINSQLGVRDENVNAANRAARRQSITTGIGQLGQLGGLAGRDRRGQTNQDELRRLLGNMTRYEIEGLFKTQ